MYNNVDDFLNLKFLFIPMALKLEPLECVYFKSKDSSNFFWKWEIVAL
jgi:hypothetical protein